jgi:hypothetical protein
MKGFFLALFLTLAVAFGAEVSVGCPPDEKTRVTADSYKLID